MGFASEGVPHLVTGSARLLIDRIDLLRAEDSYQCTVFVWF